MNLVLLSPDELAPDGTARLSGRRARHVREVLRATAGDRIQVGVVGGRLGEVLPRLKPGDLLVVTADHGNDPTTPSTDHAREHVPVFVTGSSVRGGVDIGTRQTFADLGQTIAGVLRVRPQRGQESIRP